MSLCYSYQFIDGRCGNMPLAGRTDGLVTHLYHQVVTHSVTDTTNLDGGEHDHEMGSHTLQKQFDFILVALTKFGKSVSIKLPTSILLVR
jgi:hypothetical protein